MILLSVSIRGLLLLGIIASPKISYLLPPNFRLLFDIPFFRVGGTARGNKRKQQISLSQNKIDTMYNNILSSGSSIRCPQAGNFVNRFTENKQ